MHKETAGSKIVKWLLIGISVLFVFLMLVLPLITVIAEALRNGWEQYIEAVTDKYTVKVVQLTLLATVCAVLFNTVFGLFAAWTLTKFRFKGKKVLTIVRPEFVKVAKKNENIIYRSSASEGEVIRSAFRGNYIELTIYVNGSIITANRGLDDAPVEVGERVSVFLYRMFVTVGDKAVLLENNALKGDSVFI